MRMLLDILNHGNLWPLFAASLLLYFISRSTSDENASSGGVKSALAGIAVVAFALQAWSVLKPDSAESFLELAARTILVGLMVLGVARILAPTFAYFHRNTLQVFLRRLHSWTKSRKESRERQRREGEEALRRKEAERQNREQQPNMQEIEGRAKQEAEAQQRRADARASCELYYNLHAPEISNRFNKDLFDDFVARHLGDNHPPEYVEQRAQQLVKLLKQHLAKVEPPLEALTLEQILATFDDRMYRVRESSLDERDKKIILIQLDQEREEAIQRAVRGGRL